MIPRSVAETAAGAASASEEVSDRAFLTLVADGVAARRRAEVAELVAAAEWVARQGHPRTDRDPMISPGGEGTPGLREYALPELALVRGEHTLRSRSLVADVVDLQHRLPLTWAVVVAGGCDAWVARRVAVLTRKLPAVRVGVVDAAVAAVIGGHAPSTVFEVAAAKVIEADPETHAMERERERHRRYVSLSKADEFGFRCVIAKVTAGDAAWVDALVDRVADILAATHGHDHNRDELRSVAFGWLARPADLLRLLLDHTEGPDDPNDPNDPNDPGDRDALQELGRPVWAPVHLEQTVGRLASMSVRQLAALRGRGVVFVHLTDRSHRVDAYEHPEALKDQVWTQTGGDVFPFSPRTATRDGVDFDHATAFRPRASGGPPGQTGAHNSGPLRRSHHRWKTHGGYRVRQGGPGRHLWQTPHGFCYLVDHDGTRRLDDREAELILTAPPGVDIYLDNRLVLAER